MKIVVSRLRLKRIRFFFEFAKQKFISPAAFSFPEKNRKKIHHTWIASLTIRCKWKANPKKKNRKRSKTRKKSCKRIVATEFSPKEAKTLSFTDNLITFSHFSVSVTKAEWIQCRKFHFQLNRVRIFQKRHMVCLFRCKPARQRVVRIFWKANVDADAEASQFLSR